MGMGQDSATETTSQNVIIMIGCEEQSPSWGVVHNIDPPLGGYKSKLCTLW